MKPKQKTHISGLLISLLLTVSNSDDFSLSGEIRDFVYDCTGATTAFVLSSLLKNEEHSRCRRQSGAAQFNNLRLRQQRAQAFGEKLTEVVIDGVVIDDDRRHC